GRHEPDPGPLADQHRHRDDQRHLRLQRYRGVDATKHGRARRRLRRGLRRMVRRQAMSRIVFLFLVALAVPLSAAADYLYGLNKYSGVEPYVLLIADNSGSMDERDAGCRPGCTKEKSGKCKCGNKYENELTRIEALKETLKGLIPNLDNVVLGLGKYGDVSGPIWNSEGSQCEAAITNPLPVKSGDKPPTQSALLNQVNGMSARGWTPIAL